MKYMFLIYLDEARMAALPAAEQAGFVNGMLDYDEGLRRSGHYVTSDALKPPDEAMTVRTWDGTLSTTDGPFMETKEHLAGFTMIEARDLNEAVQVAARMPMARIASIEVRPIQFIGRVAP